MSATKLRRDAVRAMERAGLSVIETFVSNRSQIRMRVADDTGTQVTVTLGWTPTSAEETIDNTVKTARRYIRAAVLARQHA